MTKLTRFDAFDGSIEEYHIEITDGDDYGGALPPLAPAEAEHLARELLRLVAVTKAETGSNGDGADGAGTDR
ncbi:hypothetical protein [Nocardia sp. BMG51109]|uniref:hypothetical protein n=1 Tax=Nocardia sp. BMG51109 TaxID=1056816 RepID=UPI0012EC564B|nr:hypothetical protein [Nocardia sp. BMG51109]